MIAAMAKAPLPRFTESAINELFTARKNSSERVFSKYSLRAKAVNLNLDLTRSKKNNKR